MSRLHLVLVLTLGLISGAFGRAAHARADEDAPSLDDIPHVTMVGHAHAEVPPDLATLTLGVVIERPTALAATNEVARVATAIVAAANAAGVAPADIRTQSITLTQTYDDTHDAQGRFTGRKPRGFEAGHTIAVRLRDLGKAGPLAQSLIEKGANRFDGIGFSVEHPEPIVAKLTADAVRDAHNQAEQAAEASGAKLGHVLQIERPSAISPRPPVVYAARVAAGPADQPVEAGVTDIEASVEATWALESR